MSARERVCEWFRALFRPSHADDGEVATLHDPDRNERPATKAA